MILFFRFLYPIKPNPSREGDGKRRVSEEDDGRAAEGKTNGCSVFLFSTILNSREEVRQGKDSTAKIRTFDATLRLLPPSHKGRMCR